MYTNKQILAGLAFVGAATAATTHRIDVGNGGLIFSPNSTTASVGDSLEFFFYPRNHSVAMSTFNSPCQSTSGFFSGYYAPSSGPADMTFTVTVNDTNPIWLYCSYGEHCQLGMVGCVNCPTSGNTLEAYAAAAKNAGSSTAPAQVEGGITAPLSSNSSSSSMSSSSTRTSMSSSATGMSGSSTASMSSTGTASASASATSAKSGASEVAVASWNIFSAAAAACGLGLYFL